MRDMQQKLIKAMDIFFKEGVKNLEYDRTIEGKVVSINNEICEVEINDEVFKCKIRNDLQIDIGDIVLVKVVNNDSSYKYVDTKLGTIGDGISEGVDWANVSNKPTEFNPSLHIQDVSTIEGLSVVATSGDYNDLASKPTIPDVSGKADLTYVNTELNKKVDKVAGKQLSTEDFTTLEKNKLINIEDGANKYIHPDNHSADMIIDGVTNKVFTATEKAKLAGISANANKVETSTTNGNIKIDGVEKTVYAHPSGTNPHGTTKIDLNLGNVENKSSATIRSEITSSNVTSALGYTPENISKKSVANGYAGLDSNAKIPLSLLPDISMNKTYVVNTIAERNALTGINTADRVYVLDAGDGSREGFIWDGTQWLKDSDTDWANVNLDWSNITGKPISLPTDIDDSVNKRHTHGNKSIIDTITQALINSWNSAVTHISDAVKHITSAERTKWNTVDNKVDKVTGKGLSAEDYTSIEKSKLAGIENGANKYILPTATDTILGGIKVGSNLSITQDGILSASSNPDSYIIREEEFVTTINQTVFNLTKGSYIPNKNMIDMYVYGQKQPKDLFIETNSTTITSKLPFEEGIRIIAKYIQSINAMPYPVHGDMHLTGGDDAIPLATTLKDGLMSKDDKAKIHNHSGNDTSHYHSTDRDRSNHSGTQLASTISDFISTVRNTVLTGLSITTNAVITTTDTVLTALGKLQKQISDNLTTLTNHIGNKNNPHTITKSQINLGNVENKSSATIRSEITSSNVTSALGYTPENISKKSVANGYAGLDSNAKIPLSLLPDISMNKTYVVNTIAERNALTGINTADRVYVLDAGDGSREGFIWDGTQWLKDSDTDWANVNLDWSNITGKPISLPTDIDDSVNKRHTHGNKSIIDTITQALINSWNSAVTHISDAVKHITSAERTKWNTVDNKVDKVTGKGLSAEDYTSIEKSKLAGIENGANKYILPTATDTILGGIKVGSNLSITQDGILSASSNPDSYIIREEEFVTTINQTVFNLTKGSYIPNKNMIDMYVYGQKQPKDLFIETNSTTITSKLPFEEGIRIIAKYIQSINAMPYPVHGDMHLTGGDDAIPLATTLQDGLMAKEDKVKINENTTALNNKEEKLGYTPVNKAGDIVSGELLLENTSVRDYLRFRRDTTGSNETEFWVSLGYGHFNIDSPDGQYLFTITKDGKVGIGTGNNSTGATQKLDVNGKIRMRTQTKGSDSDDTVATKKYVDDGLDSKVNNSRVLTDVPAGAKFTDTTYSEITTDEIDTGTSGTLKAITGRRIKYVLDKVQNWINSLTKADVGLSNVDNVKQASKSEFDSHNSDSIKHITSTERSNWNAKETVSGAQSKANAAESSAKSYVDGKVLTNVPLNAKFTDTIYTHPSSHPASMITESTTKRFVSDAEKNNWNSKAEISDIPTKVGQLQNDKNYVTQSDLGEAGLGDMTKGVYDTNNNGKVDIAEVAETVVGDEIQLGGRFKIVYNDIEDSLDIEVI